MRIGRGLLPGHVLQRRPEGAGAEIFGACSAEGPVLATVRSRAGALPGWQNRPAGSARNGCFHAEIRGLPPGGPYSVELACGPERVTVRGVRVGDLWLMAGQSNMEGSGFLPGDASPHPLVRVFTMARYWEMARDPLHVRSDSPDPVHHRNPGRGGAGVGLPFARLMLEKTGVPQGLIAAAHGGTTMAQWDPALKKLGGESLYGSMWLSLRTVGQPLAGVLWYQGESEALPELARRYTANMRRLVTAVRRDLKQPGLPWLMAQIGRFIKTNPEDEWPDPDAWNSVQEQQRRLPGIIPRCAGVPAADLPLDDCAHLSAAVFGTLAARFARAAQTLLSGKDGAKFGIRPRNLRLETGFPRGEARITIEFDGISGGLRSMGLARGFSVLDSAGRPLALIFHANVERRRVILRLTAPPPRGASVAYGHGFDAGCNLVDDSGMAVPVFGPLKLPRPAAKPA